MLSCHQIKHSGAIAGVQQLGDHQLQQITILSGVQQVAEHQVGSGCTDDPYWADVVLLMNMQEDFTDAKGHTVSTYGNVHIDDSSALFDGTGDYFTVSNTDFSYGSAPFCIEFWIRPASDPGTVYASMGLFPKSLLIRTGGDQIYLLANTGSGWNRGITSSDGALPYNTWTHVAFVRDGTTLGLYINGVLNVSQNIGSESLSAPDRPVFVGVDSFSGTVGLNGRIKALRITKNARYTANFTPPSAPFPDS